MATATPADVGTATLLRAAIADRRLVTFTFDGFQRKAEPHDYGILDGLPTLFFWQVRSAKPSPRPVGWRRAVLTRITDLKVLDERFPGPRPTSTGRHIQWDRLIATVSPRPTSE